MQLNGTVKLAGLTARELEIIKAAAEGLVNKEIAAHLHISERMVKWHLEHIYIKLGFADGSTGTSKRVKVARWAWRNNL